MLELQLYLPLLLAGPGGVGGDGVGGDVLLPLHGWGPPLLSAVGPHPRVVPGVGPGPGVDGGPLALPADPCPLGFCPQ